MVKHWFDRATTRRLAAFVVAVAATALSLAAAPAAPALAAPSSFTLKIGMTATNGVVTGNMAWGEHAGTLLKALAPVGVTKITFATFQAGPEVQAALQSGAIDVAVNGDLPALQARGTPAADHTRQIGFTSINGDTWLIGKKGGPKTVAGLVGGTIGAPTNTVRYRLAYGLLSLKGLTNKVHLSNLGTPAAVAALESGQIDATVVGGTQAIQLEREGYPVIAKASQYPTLMSTEQSTAYPAFLSKHPGFVRAWGKALVATNKSIHAHAKAFWAYLAPIDKVTPAIEKAGNPLNQYNETPFPAAGIKQLESTYNFCVSLELIQRPFHVTSWLDQP